MWVLDLAAAKVVLIFLFCYPSFHLLKSISKDLTFRPASPASCSSQASDGSGRSGASVDEAGRGGSILFSRVKSVKNMVGSKKKPPFLWQSAKKRYLCGRNQHKTLTDEADIIYYSSGADGLYAVAFAVADVHYDEGECHYKREEPVPQWHVLGLCHAEFLRERASKEDGQDLRLL